MLKRWKRGVALALTGCLLGGAVLTGCGAAPVDDNHNSGANIGADMDAKILTGDLSDARALELAALLGGSPEEVNERLNQVTRLVKTALNLDTDIYTDFRGDVTEEAAGIVWDLYWSGENGDLNINALESGTIVRYWRNDNNADYSVYTGYLSAFPKSDKARMKAAADEFVKKILDPETETVEWVENDSNRSLGENNAYFYGNILLNGLPSPLSCNITVRGTDNQVIHFYRDAPESSFLGNIPSKDPEVSESDAAEKLKTTQNLELIYVKDNNNDNNHAVLRYAPKDIKTRYVDARTGELVDAEEMSAYNTTARDMGAVAEEMEMADDAGGMALKSLNEVELEGVRQLEGVLKTDELDQIIRSESAYQLDDYILASSGYRQIRDDYNIRPLSAEKNNNNNNNNNNNPARIVCNLRYSIRMDNGDTRDHYFTVDARTGHVESLYSDYDWEKDRTPDVKSGDAQKTAEDFLKRYLDAQYQDKTPLYNAVDNIKNGAAYYEFDFARQENQYFFPENYCNIQIDCMTGAVSGLSYHFDENMIFDSPDGIVTPEAALNAWMGIFNTVLAYRYLPKELNKNAEMLSDAQSRVEARLIANGYTSFYTLFLSYGLEREIDCPGIDAKTGKPAENQSVSDDKLNYQDIANTPAKAEIEKLAEYGIGYNGGAFQPDKDLTQWDAVALLASTRGWRIAPNPDNASDDDKNNAYHYIYRMDALKSDERDDNKIMTRDDLIKLYLNAAGYRSVANLTGIFTCDYTDLNQIPAESLGYAAIARGLNIIRDQSYQADQTTTRADAAVFLCRLLERAL